MYLNNVVYFLHTILFCLCCSSLFCYYVFIIDIVERNVKCGINKKGLQKVQMWKHQFVKGVIILAISMRLHLYRWLGLMQMTAAGDSCF